MTLVTLVTLTSTLVTLAAEGPVVGGMAEAERGAGVGASRYDEGICEKTKENILDLDLGWGFRVEGWNLGRERELDYLSLKSGPVS